MRLLETGNFLFQNGNYDEAYNVFKNIADRGNVNAYFMLAKILYEQKKYNDAGSMMLLAALHGNSTAKEIHKPYPGDDKVVESLTNVYNSYYDEDDIETALIYVKGLAFYGDANAQTVLGILYNDGNILESNWDLAQLWLSLATLQSFKKAIDILGLQPSLQDVRALAHRFLSDKKYELSYILFRGLANQEYANDQFYTGFMLEHGLGLLEDKVEALKWYERAQLQGDLDASTSLGEIYLEGTIVDQNFDFAVKLLKFASDAGHPRAQASLGRMYKNGNGVERNLEEAERLLYFAAEQGHAIAEKELKEIYASTQKQFNKDSEKLFEEAMTDYQNDKYNYAADSFKKLAAFGHANAQFMLGYMYTHGEGVPKNYNKAFEWYLLSAKQGHSSAQYELSNFYHFGFGLDEANMNESMKWLKISADNGNDEAQGMLGLRYLQGDGVQKDINEAIKWFTLASEQGHFQSKKSLERLGYYAKESTQNSLFKSMMGNFFK